MTAPDGVARRWRRPEAGSDDGQIMVLALGFTVVLLLLVTVIVSLTGIQLERKRLANLADNLALEAADSIDEGSIYGTGVPPSEAAEAPLTDEGVRAAVAEYLAANPGATIGLESVTIVSATTPDGRTARVVLASRARPTLISPVTSLFSDGVVLTVESTARAWEP
ncbi:pilus assembly protein TadG-related protein [Sanguibacter sp. 25GB23B1]|uniref:pilus assembly protein TadG-related protein n=1 Tax=unclassified Sanguibacter TaxID=2645534 RepID=UPI0032AF24F7